MSYSNNIHSFTGLNENKNILLSQKTCFKKTKLRNITLVESTLCVLFPLGIIQSSAPHLWWKSSQIVLQERTCLLLLIHNQCLWSHWRKGKRLVRIVAKGYQQNSHKKILSKVVLICSVKSQNEVIFFFFFPQHYINDS